MASTRRRRTIGVLGGLGLALSLGVSLAGPTAAQGAVARVASYINPDTGKPTANPDVRSASSCSAPDAADTQAVGDPATGMGNVHNDACLFDASGAAVDTAVTFETSGVGGVFGCPDPDKDGPKTAAKHDHDGDGLSEHCHLSGFEAANSEYHARLISASAGRQTVTFCADETAAPDGAGAPTGHGCGDATARGTVRITWAPRGGAATGQAPLPLSPARTTVSAVALAALLAAAGGVFVGARARS